MVNDRASQKCRRGLIHIRIENNDELLRVQGKQLKDWKPYPERI